MRTNAILEKALLDINRTAYDCWYEVHTLPQPVREALPTRTKQVMAEADAADLLLRQRYLPLPQALMTDDEWRGWHGLTQTILRTNLMSLVTDRDRLRATRDADVRLTIRAPHFLVAQPQWHGYLEKQCLAVVSAAVGIPFLRLCPVRWEGIDGDLGEWDVEIYAGWDPEAEVVS